MIQPNTNYSWVISACQRVNQVVVEVVLRIVLVTDFAEIGRDVAALG